MLHRQLRRGKNDYHPHYNGRSGDRLSYNGFCYQSPAETAPAGYVLPSLASLTHHRPGAGEIQAIEHHLTCAARQAVSNDLHFTLPAFPKKVITSIVCATASPGMLSRRKTDSSGITTLKATRFICLRFWMNLFRPQMSLM